MAEKKTEKAWNIKNAIKSLNRKSSDITDDFLVFFTERIIFPENAAFDGFLPYQKQRFPCDRAIPYVFAQLLRQIKIWTTIHLPAGQQR